MENDAIRVSSLVIYAMDTLENWTQECRRQHSNAERSIGKRKREEDFDDDIGKHTYASTFDGISDQNAGVLQTLKVCLVSHHSKCNTLLYFYLEFVYLFINSAGKMSNKSYMLVVQSIVQFLVEECDKVLAIIVRKELLLQILNILCCISWDQTSNVANSCVLTFIKVTENLLTRCCSSCSSSDNAECYFISGKYSDQRFQAEIYRSCTMFLNKCISYDNVIRKIPAYNINIRESGVNLWHKCHETIHLNTVLTQLAEDDEALFSHLLYIIKALNALEAIKNSQSTSTDSNIIAVQTYCADTCDSNHETTHNIYSNCHEKIYAETVSSLCYLVDRIFGWDDNVLLDFVNSEETVALEYWLRIMKRLSWSDLAHYYTKKLSELANDNYNNSDSGNDDTIHDIDTTTKYKSTKKILVLVEEITFPVLPSSFSEIPVSFQPDTLTLLPISTAIQRDTYSHLGDKSDASSRSKTYDDEICEDDSELEGDDVSEEEQREQEEESKNGNSDNSDNIDNRKRIPGREASSTDVNTPSSKIALNPSLHMYYQIWHRFLSCCQESLERRHRHKLLAFSPLPLIRALGRFLETMITIE